MGASGFRALVVWQKAKSLAIFVYEATEVGPIARDFGLRDQMRRAAVSVCSNIAEGDERETDKESVRFFYIAKGSLAELQTQAEIARELALVREDLGEEIENRAAEIGRLLGALIRRRKA
ncbi:MAG: four helix bundle protein [Betaproteobacteria bacterium]|nr:four helix bundle protein [Betaproteobacteria bacterium]